METLALHIVITYLLHVLCQCYVFHYSETHPANPTKQGIMTDGQVKALEDQIELLQKEVCTLSYLSGVHQVCL